MATNPTGLKGALFDPAPANALGGLCSGIGIGINAVYGPPIAAGLTLNDGSPVPAIGAAPPYGARAQAVGYAGKVIVLSKATAAVAPGAALPSGGINQTGKTVPIGGGAYGVAP